MTNLKQIYNKLSLVENPTCFRFVSDLGTSVSPRKVISGSLLHKSTTNLEPTMASQQTISVYICFRFEGLCWPSEGYIWDQT